MPILTSPKLKITGIKKKDCAFVRNYKAEIGDIVQFDYNPCEYGPEVTITFLNKDKCAEIRSVNLRSFDSFIETEVVTDSGKPKTQAESFEL